MRFIDVVFVSLLLLITSCESNNNKYFIDKIDSLSFQLEEAITAYNKVDTVAVSDIRNTVKTNCKGVRNDDNPEVMSTFITYSHIDKSMKQILRMDARIKIETEISLTQLSNLHHDVSRNLINEDLLKIHLSEEKQIVLALINRMEFNTQHVLNETTRFDSLNPIIESYLKHSN